LLAVAAAVEGATGLALVAYPPMVTLLLLGYKVSGPAMAVGRIAGLALLSLGIACWPARDIAGRKSQSHRAMLTYNLLVALYLLRIGVGCEMAGALLWPAFVLHATLAILLVRAWFSDAWAPGKVELVNWTL